ncbi:type III-B CRISPR module RAMP protein Cmr4 [Microbacterium sp.]|uniref:type III-B CRISPR module RAMP protein Cmr4 n=1 Tax=Microbacterium sp. TaxID=51671 RepID=UPI0039E44C44
MNEVVLYLYAETPVHAGADQSLGVVDDPIQREVSTRYPVIWGQSLKGALREHARNIDGVDVARLFGTERDGPTEKDRGRLSIGDAQVVAFPVPTVTRTFAWVTSELALARLSRKRARAGLADLPVPVCRVGRALRAAESTWADDNEVFGVSVVDTKKDEDAAGPTSQWAKHLASDALPPDEFFGHFRTKIAADLVVLHDDDFRDNVVFGTEVATRIALEREAKRVFEGALFTVEYLPTDTLLAASIACRDQADRDAIRHIFECSRLLRLGGDETVGKGVLWCQLEEADASTGGAAK